MPYVDPDTVQNAQAGQVLQAARLDADRAALEYLARNFPHCSIKESTPQSIPTATWTALTSNEENSDIGGMHSTVTNTSRITVPAGEGGLYQVTAAITFAQPGGAAGERFVGVGKNGAAPTYSLASATALTASATSLSGATQFVLADGDWLDCMVFHTRGSNLDCTLNDFSGAWRAVA